MSVAAKRFTLLVPLLILGGVLYGFKYIGYQDVLKSLQELRTPAIGLIVLIGLVGGLIQTLKLKVVCRGVANIHILDSYLVYPGGNFVSTITPGYNIGGEPVRAFYLNALYGDGKSSFMSLVLLDRFFNLIAVVFFALVALGLVLFRYSFNLAEATSVMISLTVIVFLVVLVITFQGRYPERLAVRYCGRSMRFPSLLYGESIRIGQLTRRSCNSNPRHSWTPC